MFFLFSSLTDFFLYSENATLKKMMSPVTPRMEKMITLEQINTQGLKLVQHIDTKKRSRVP